MLSNAFKPLVLAMAFLYVAARPESEDIPLETEADEMDIEVPETEDDEMNNVEMDDAMTKEERQLKVRPPIFKPIVRCPFDCAKVCVRKYPFTWGIPPKTHYFYVCDRRVYNCCKRACFYYQNCINSGRPAWACYAETLDFLCRCRRIRQQNFQIQVKGGKGK